MVRSSMSQEAQREYNRCYLTNPINRARHNKRRTDHQHRNLAVIQAIKLEQGCADCGYNTHAEALDFDHLDGHTKSMNVRPECANVVTVGFRIDPRLENDE
jgi:hypothetical protein